MSQGKTVSPWLVMITAVVICGSLLTVTPMIRDMLLGNLPNDMTRDVYQELVRETVLFVLLGLFGWIANRALGTGVIKLGKMPVLLTPVWAIVGGLAVAAALVICSSLGRVELISGAGIASPGLFAAAALVILVQSTAEEVFFRGWVQSSLTKAWGPWVAIVAGALLFSLVHYLGQPRDILSLANLFLVGLMLGLLFRMSGGILAPAMLHFGWNITEAGILGLSPNPGVESFGSFFNYDIAGSSLAGGSAEGLNASVALGIVVAVLSVIIASPLFRSANATQPAKAPSAAPKATPKQPAPAPAPAPVAAATIPAMPQDDELTHPVSARPHDDATLLSEADEASKVRLSTALGDISQDDPLLLTKTGNVTEGAIVLEGVAFSHTGRVRELNEDRFMIKPPIGLWAVADGMGGHARGDLASSMIVEMLATSPLKASLEDRIQATEAAVAKANAGIFRESEAIGQRMGSTVVCLVTAGNRFAVVWAGDSRAYLSRDGKLMQVSKDHTQVQELVDKGAITVEEAAHHPLSHVLARAVGVMPEVALDHVVGELQPGDTFLLCSDGLYGVVDEVEIGTLMRRGDQTDGTRKLLQMALERGAPDNVTIVTVTARSAADRKPN